MPDRPPQFFAASELPARDDPWTRRSRLRAERVRNRERSHRPPSSRDRSARPYRSSPAARVAQRVALRDRGLDLEPTDSAWRAEVRARSRVARLRALARDDSDSVRGVAQTRNWPTP